MKGRSGRVFPNMFSASSITQTIAGTSPAGLLLFQDIVAYQIRDVVLWRTQVDILHHNLRNLCGDYGRYSPQQNSQALRQRPSDRVQTPDPPLTIAPIAVEAATRYGSWTVAPRLGNSGAYRARCRLVRNRALLHGRRQDKCPRTWPAPVLRPARKGRHHPHRIPPAGGRKHHRSGHRRQLSATHRYIPQ